MANMIVVGGLTAWGLYWIIRKYFKNQRTPMPLDPSVHQNIPKTSIVIPVETSFYRWSSEPQMNVEAKIRSARTKLGLDAENSVNIAVCGNSGTGKSTFINCIRGIPDVELNDIFIYKPDGPAPVGILETTKEIQSYRWPNGEREHLTLWDLPAVGKMNRPEQSYFEEHSLYAFDCILLLRAGRFTQFDVDICIQASRYNIPIALVLSKVDEDVASFTKIRVRSLGRSLTKAEYVNVIDNTIENLKQNAKAEIAAISGSEGQNLDKIPMFAIAAQSYRKHKHNMLDERECPPLETENLIRYCLNIIIEYRQMKENNCNMQTS